MKRAIIGAISFALALSAFGIVETSPSPHATVDWSKVPNAEGQVQQMIAHRNELHQQLLNQTLPDASDDVKAAVDKAQNLQKQIDALAISAEQVPVLQDQLKKAHAACWRDLFLGLVAGAVLGLIGPKLLGLASMVGV